MTKKGEKIESQIIRLLERNPDGLRIGRLTELMEVSRNSVYRYLHALEFKKIVIRLPETKLWALTHPIQSKTILGYQYQALLQGLRKIGGNFWDIDTDEGKIHFKELGRYISPKMKGSTLVDLAELKNKTHYLQDIIEFGMKLVDEASSVEQYRIEFKLDEQGYPTELTNLAGVITFSGGYVQSDKVKGNGFAHYYIIAGIIEASLDRVIPEIYGGRVVVDIHTMDDSDQRVDLGIYIIFDKETPFIDPQSRRKIPFPQKEIRQRK